MITLTPLSASASSSSSSEPICYLLELDDARILLDMGQRDFRANQEHTSWEYEEKIREIAPTLSLVLLSHSLLNYLSLYPYARAHWGLKCPVYATQPTVEMGRVVCLAESESWLSEHKLESPEDEEVPTSASPMNGGLQEQQQVVATSSKGKQPLRGPFVPTLEEVHEAFDHIKAIRYNQPLHLSGDLSHVLLTPFPSGHTLGGSLFKLRSPTSGTVLYAVGMNHTSERHIDGMVGGAGNIGYDEGVLRPDLLIVEAGRTNMVNAKRRDREAALLDTITNTLQSHFSVLLPCDPSPRLLELLVLLDQHWSFKSSENNNNQNSRFRNPEQWVYPLCLVSRTAQDMVSFARSLIEWMGGVVRDAAVGLEEDMNRKRRRMRGGQGMETSYGALDFKHVQFFSTPVELMQAYPLSRPKMVLAIPPSMSHGPSRWLFTAMAGMEGNVILLTSQGEDGTLARQLFEDWQLSQPENKRYGSGSIGTISKIDQHLSLEMDSKVPLSGVELEDHLEAERLAKEKQAAHQAAMDRSRRMLEADDLDSDSDSDDDSIAAADNLLRMDTNALTGRGAAGGAGAGAGTGTGAGENEVQMSFDIFVKGQQMRQNRGREESKAGRFRMFPYAERRGRKVDDYGETLDIGQWVRKGKEIEEEGETQEVREAKRKKQEEEERQLVPPDPPSKFITETNVIDVRASVLYIDMDGLHDGQAIKTIISDLQPRQLILIRSSEEATRALGDFLSSSSGIKEVHAPGTNEIIKIGQHVQSYSFALGDSLTSGLNTKWSKFEGYEVTMVDGKIAFSMGSTVPTLERGELVLPIRREEEAVAEIKPDTTTTTTTGLAIEAPPAEVPADQASGQEPVPIEVDSQPDATSAASAAVVNADAGTEPETGPAPSEDPMVVKSEPVDQPPESSIAIVTEATQEQEIIPSKPPRDLSLRRQPPKLPLPTSLFIGDLRLTLLRTRLQNLTPPIPAEFAGSGILICGPGVLALANQSHGDGGGGGGGEVKAGSIVAVRKGEKGVEIEGSVGGVYDLVRKEVYGSFAQVSA